MKECVGVPEGSSGEAEKVYEETRYIFVRLNVLREYLEKELAMPGVPFKYDFDRAIDDWVFMCFFVGEYFIYDIKCSVCIIACITDTCKRLVY